MAERADETCSLSLNIAEIPAGLLERPAGKRSAGIGKLVHALKAPALFAGASSPSTRPPL